MTETISPIDPYSQELVKYLKEKLKEATRGELIGIGGFWVYEKVPEAVVETMGHFHTGRATLGAAMELMMDVYMIENSVVMLEAE